MKELPFGVTDPNSQSLLFGMGLDIGVEADSRDSTFESSDGTNTLFFCACLEEESSGVGEIHGILVAGEFAVTDDVPTTFPPKLPGKRVVLQCGAQFFK